MSLGARLLASGALGSLSGIILAAGVLAMLSGPAHAQTTPSRDQRQPVVATQDIDGNSLLGGRSTTAHSTTRDADSAESIGQTSSATTTNSRSSSTTPTRQGNSTLVLNGSLHLK